MIEWWQALLISIPGAVLGGAVVGIVTLLAQQRQLNHEREMQADRLAAESENLSRERERDIRQSELEPVFDLLREIDVRVVSAVWSGSIDRAREQIGQSYSEAFSSEMTAEEWEKLKRVLMEHTASPQPDLVARLAGVLHRVRDLQIQTDLVAVAALLIQSDGPTLSGISPTLARIHTRLEKYVASGEAG